MSAQPADPIAASEQSTDPVAASEQPRSQAALEAGEYVGFVTRVVAQIFDLVVINLLALLIWGAFSLVLAAVHSNHRLSPGLLVSTGGGWALVLSALYFVSFWSVTGQTVGARLMGFRVVRADDFERLGLGRAARRLLGQWLCGLTLGIGYLPVLATDRRRGLHDWIGASVVRWDHPDWAIRTWAARRAARALRQSTGDGAQSDG